jgi:heterodisulfide reductase subunit A
LITLAELQGIQGKSGDFSVEILKQPRYVDEEKCIACGNCSEKCPKKVVDPYNAGLAKRKAIYVEYAQAVPLKYAIDAENCIWFQKNGKCGACKKLCPTGAVDFDQKPETLSLEVGSVIMAPGYQPFDPGNLDIYQYETRPNLITSLEMERFLSATGPSQGHLVRPSDGTEPKKIAWLQCIGSRDINRCDNAYCSSVCCMYAIKEAVIAKEHAGDLDATIFFMDIRTYGKDFERYYDRAREEAGVNFVRARVHSIEEDPETKDLILRFADTDGVIRNETYDMVVLSVGMETSRQVVDMAKRVKVDLDADRFARTDSFAPVETSRKGIYVCGAFLEPKDIPQSVMEASAAAAGAQVDLADARGTQVSEKRYPDEKAVASEEPRIGVFVCNCGINIGGIVDVPAVAEMARKLPGVVYVEENLFTCSQDTQDKMKEVIEKET